MEHADLQASLQRLRAAEPLDQLAIRRLEKRGLQLRDQIARLELVLDPKEPA
nr:YdcH family protein [Ramlibacter lithotrophicus]